MGDKISSKTKVLPLKHESDSELPERLRKLQQMIDSGTYRVKTEEISEKLSELFLSGSDLDKKDAESIDTVQSSSEGAMRLNKIPKLLK